MKKNLYTIAIAALFLAPFVNAQNVGIGTAAPNASAKLDITDANRGVLIPRVALTATNLAGPVTAPATSLLVYNTATAGVAPNNVTPGFYYWSGTQWVRFSTGGDDWKITGNANTTFGTNFLGTTNAQGLDFRTNNVIRLRIPVANQVHANSLGTTALPFYSFAADPNTGIWSSAADFLNFSTAGLERLELGTAEAVFNDLGGNYDFRVESDARTHMFFVDANVNNIGINTAAPGNQVHFVSDGRTGWVTFWSNTTGGGGLKQVYNSSTANGSRVFMGVTNYSASALEAAAVMGLSLNNTTTGSGGIGVMGSANNESGNAVEGSLYFVGAYSGWAGYFNGDVYSGGAYVGSDRRLKKDIKSINGALSLIDKIEPVSYKYNTERYPQIGLDEDRLTYGFIAQDLEEVLPELVKEKNLVLNSNRLKSAEDVSDDRQTDKFKVVNYTLMIPILTQAVKEQQEIIEAQNKRIEALEMLTKELMDRK